MEEKLNKINCLTETCSKVFIQLQWPITSCVWTTVTATSHLHLALPIHSSQSSQRDPLNKTAHLIPMLKKPSVISHHPSNKIHKPFHKMYVFTESCLPLQSHPSPVFPWVTLLKSSGLLSVFFLKKPSFSLVFAHAVISSQNLFPDLYGASSYHMRLNFRCYLPREAISDHIICLCAY